MLPIVVAALEGRGNVLLLLLPEEKNLCLHLPSGIDTSRGEGRKGRKKLIFFTLGLLSDSPTLKVGHTTVHVVGQKQQQENGGWTLRVVESGVRPLKVLSDLGCCFLVVLQDERRL